MNDEAIFRIFSFLDAETNVRTAKPTRARCSSSTLMACILRREPVTIFIPTNEVAREFEENICVWYNEYCRDWEGWQPASQDMILRIKANNEGCKKYQTLLQQYPWYKLFTYYRNCQNCPFLDDCEFLEEIETAKPIVTIVNYNKAAVTFMNRFGDGVNKLIWDHINKPHLKIIDEYDDVLPCNSGGHEIYDYQSKYVAESPFTFQVRQAVEELRMRTNSLEKKAERIRDEEESKKLQKQIESQRRLVGNFDALEEFLVKTKHALCPQILEFDHEINVVEMELFLQHMAMEGEPYAYVPMSHFLSLMSNSHLFFYADQANNSKSIIPLNNDIHILVNYFANKKRNHIIFMSASGESMNVQKILKLEEPVKTMVFPDFRETEKSQLVIASNFQFSVTEAKKFPSKYQEQFKLWMDRYAEVCDEPVDFRGKNKHITNLSKKFLPDDSFVSWYHGSSSRGVQSSHNIMVLVGFPYQPRFSAAASAIKYSTTFENPTLRKRLIEVFNKFMEDVKIMGFKIDDVVKYLQGDEMPPKMKAKMDRKIRQDILEKYQRGVLINEIFKFEQEVRQGEEWRHCKQVLGRCKDALGERRSVVLSYGIKEEEWKDSLASWATETPTLVTPLSSKEKYTQFYMCKMWRDGFPYEGRDSLPILARIIELTLKYGSSTPSSVARNIKSIDTYQVADAIRKYSEWLAKFGCDANDFRGSWRVKKVK